jgi:hypothetical protein
MQSSDLTKFKFAANIAGPYCSACCAGGGSAGPAGPTGPTGAISSWSEYPAIQSVDMSCNLINDLSAINFCDGTYIGPGSSFDISANQVLVLSGLEDPSGNYNGAAIVSKNRVYQQLNSDSSWNDINGFYGLAKNAYPALNPYSVGAKAVSTWTQRLSATPTNWSAVEWSAELHLFAAVSTSGTNNRVMTSPDGIVWTTRISAADILWRSISWSSELGLFVAVASSGLTSSQNNRIMTSSDGITWNLPPQTQSLANSWRYVCWSPQLGIFAAVAGTGGTSIPSVMTSSNGTDWTLQTLPSGAIQDWRSICWSPELELFVAVANSGSGNRVMTSSDGIIWVSRASAADNNWNSVCWSSELGIFVAVSGTGGTGIPAVMTSSDGINWELHSAAAANDWRSVCWSRELGIFVAVAITGLGDRVMSSPDGLTWVVRPSPVDNGWISVCWAPELGIFSAVALAGNSNRAMTSSLIGRPPTSYNVFDSSFNQIDQNGNWTIQQVLKAGTYTAGQTTPSVAGTNLLSITNAGATTITNLTGGVANQQIVLVFNDDNTTLQANANLRLVGAVNFVGSQYDTLTLLRTATEWVEVCRSVNT